MPIGDFLHASRHEFDDIKSRLKVCVTCIQYFSLCSVYVQSMFSLCSVYVQVYKFRAHTDFLLPFRHGRFVGKECGVRWKVLGGAARKKYEALNEADKVRHTKEMEGYEAPPVEYEEAKEGKEAKVNGSGAGVKRDRAGAGGGGTKNEGRNAALVAAAHDDNDYDHADADDDTRRTSAGKRCRTLNTGGPCLEMPSGLVFEYLSRDEAVFLHNEIFTQDTYFHPDGGIALYADSTVIDVGANLGLFTLRCAAEAERVRTLAFEPIRATFEVMRRNVAHLPLVQPRRLALGQAAESVVFESYEDMPGEATRYPLERSAQRAALLHAAKVRTHTSVGQAGTGWGSVGHVPSSRLFFPPRPASLPSSPSCVSSFFTSFLPSSPCVSPFVLFLRLFLLHVRVYPYSLRIHPPIFFSMIRSPNKHSKRTHPWCSLLCATLKHCCPCPCLTRRNQRMDQ